MKQGETNYYRLLQSLNDDYVIVSELRLPHTEDGRISSGTVGREILVPVPKPLHIEVDRLNGEVPRHFVTAPRMVIVSALFLDALKAAGVDNFQIFPVTLCDVQTERTWNNYFLFNGVGVIDAISQEDCDYTTLIEGDDERYPFLGFTKVVFSAKKVRKGYKMFRLVQDPSDQLYISEEVLSVLRETAPPEGWGIRWKKVEIK